MLQACSWPSACKMVLAYSAARSCNVTSTKGCNFSPEHSMSWREECVAFFMWRQLKRQNIVILARTGEYRRFLLDLMRGFLFIKTKGPMFMSSCLWILHSTDMQILQPDSAVLVQLQIWTRLQATALMGLHPAALLHRTHVPYRSHVGLPLSY